MSATILKFPERRQTAIPGKTNLPLINGAISVSEFDCAMLDAIRNTADHALDVTRVPKDMLESFLHQGLTLGSEFGFGQRRYQLRFQVEDLTPPKSFA